MFSEKATKFEKISFFYHFDLPDDEDITEVLLETVLEGFDGSEESSLK